jgi:RNA polymerase sigma-70 factor (ECF subfamily)
MIISKKEFQLIKKRDAAALTRFYNLYKKTVYNYLLGKAKGNEDIAGELFCEVNAVVLLSVGKLNHNNNLLGWILKIAHRKYCNFVRKSSRDKKLLENLVFLQQNRPDMEDNRNNRERKAAIFNTALANIKKKYRDVIRLKYFDKKSIKELSVMFNMTEVAIGGLLFRAKEKLKKEVQSLIKYM